MSYRHCPLSLAAVLAALSLGGCEGAGLWRETAEALDAAADDVTAPAPGEVVDATPPEDALPSDAEGPADDTADAAGPAEETPAWEPVVLGDVGGLDAVAAASADAIWAVSGPRVLRWNGASWLSFGSPAGEEAGGALHGLWSDGVTVVVVGDGGLIARRPASGATPWVREDAGVEVDLWAVAGRGASDLLAVGDEGVILRHTGSGWQKRHERAGLRLRGAFAGPGEGDANLRAVGSGGQLVEAAGGVWRCTQIARSAATLSGFTALSDGTLLAVGTAHTLTARRPTAPAWQGETSNDTRERDVHAVVSLADGSVRAFGADGLVLARDGAGLWQLETVPQAGVLGFSSAASFGSSASPGLVALARDGGGLMLRAGAWSSLVTRPDAAIRGLTLDADGRLWAAGARGTLLVRSPSQGFSAWPLPAEVDLHAVAADPTGGVWAVGAAGRLIQVSATGAVTPVELPVPVDLHDVAVSATHVVAVGRGGTILVLSRETGAVTFRASGTVADLHAVAIASADGDGGEDTLWIAGSYGTVLRGAVADSRALVTLDTGTGASLRDLALDRGGPGGTRSSGAAWAVGDGGVILRLAAGPEATVTLAHEAPGVFLRAVAASRGGVIAVGEGGVILARAAGAEAFTPERGASPQGRYGAVVVDEAGVAWLGSNQRAASLERRVAPWGEGEAP